MNLRGDPFEAGVDAMAYKTWMFEHIFALVPAQDIVGGFLKTLQEYPPRQKPGSFGIDKAMEQILNAKQN
jgi:arylsulfatase